MNSTLSSAQLAEVAALIAEATAASQADTDAFYLLYAASLVFMMQAGFAMLCAGTVRAKNAKNIMLKNLLDACVGAVGFWAIGYGVAYGAEDGGNWFCGNSLFFLGGNFEDIDSYHGWFFQFAFAATAATIVSGSVAERCQMGAYACYSAVLTTWVYPVVAHWIWSTEGWLSAFTEDPLLGVGVVDFAGCGVVHMVGGAAALAGAWILGPRLGRFNDDGTVNAMPGHNAALVVLGTFILWFGWYGFNPGSTLGIHGYAFIAAKTAATTTLSAATGAVVNLFVTLKLSGDAHTYDLEETCNGALAGLVGITSACSVVELWASLFIGAIAVLWYQAGRLLLLRLRVDDVVNAAPVHLFAGSWGLLAPAFFASPNNLLNTYGVERDSGIAGLLYGGDGKMLGCQLLALVSVLIWTFAHMVPAFMLMNKYNIFRVSADMEEEGLDVSKHGGSAYPEIDMSGSGTGRMSKKISVAPEAQGVEC